MTCVNVTCPQGSLSSVCGRLRVARSPTGAQSRCRRNRLRCDQNASSASRLFRGFHQVFCAPAANGAGAGTRVARKSASRKTFAWEAVSLRIRAHVPRPRNPQPTRLRRRNSPRCWPNLKRAKVLASPVAKPRGPKVGGKSVAASFRSVVIRRLSISVARDDGAIPLDELRGPDGIDCPGRG